MAIGRPQIFESIDMQDGGDPFVEENRKLKSLADLIRGRVDTFDFDTKRQSYEDRLSQLAPQPEKFDIYDLATSISQGLTAQQQAAGPDSIGQGLAMGFNLASADIKERDKLTQQAKKEIGLQATQLAMRDEKEAQDFLDKALFELSKQSGTAGVKQTADITNYEFRESLDAEGKKDFDAMKNRDPFAAYLLAEARRKGGSPGGLDLSPAQKAVDQEFGKTLAKYELGDKAQVEANLRNLQSLIKIVEDGELNISGPVVGILPDAVQSFVNPDALSFQTDIRDIVFQSLREKLGAQFTEREGDRLVAAAFNPLLSEEKNIARLQRLYFTVHSAKEAKEAAYQYYKDNGSLKGYEAVPINFDSIMSDLVSTTDYENMSNDELERIFPTVDPYEQEVILEIARKRESE